MAGSEPKSNPFCVRGNGSGKSTPVKVLPPLVEYIARIGRRWISFDPAITLLVLCGLIAIAVSLCDPHSWLASTLLPNRSEPTEPELPPHRSVVPLDTARYFSYQDAPSYDLRLPATAGAALPSNARA